MVAEESASKEAAIVKVRCATTSSSLRSSAAFILTSTAAKSLLASSGTVLIIGMRRWRTWRLAQSARQWALPGKGKGTTAAADRMRYRKSKQIRPGRLGSIEAKKGRVAVRKGQVLRELIRVDRAPVRGGGNAADVFAEHAQIMLKLVLLESRGHELSMPCVIGSITKQKPTVEMTSEHRLPTPVSREVALSVEENEFVRFGSNQLHVPVAASVQPVNRPKLFVHATSETEWIPHCLRQDP